MKRKLTTALTAFAALTMCAQSFTIHTTDGRTIGYSNDKVERIEFSLDPVQTPADPLNFSNFVTGMTPAEGVVDTKAIPTGLGHITINLKGVFKANEKCDRPLTLSNSQGAIYSRKATDEGIYTYFDVLSNTTEFSYTFNPAGFVTPGNYYLDIPEGFYVDTNGNPLGGAIRVFVIERGAPSQTFVTTPSQGAVDKIETIDFRFDEYRSLTVNASARAYVYEEGSSTAVASATPTATADGSFTVTFAPAITTPGIYTVSIPAGAFTLRETDNGKAYSSNEVKAVFEIIRSELPEPRLGDFYYSDGTWSSTLVDREGAEPIGVIFYVGEGPGDNKSFYKVKDGSAPIEEFHGYVIALHDATYIDGEHVKTPWKAGAFDGNDTGCGCSSSTSDFVGYTNTISIRNLAKREFGDLKADNLAAAYYAAEYFETQVPAPAQSSGWFLPSAGQLKYIWDSAYFEPNGNPDGPYIEKSLNQLEEFGAMPMYVRDCKYWSSSEYYDSSGYSVRAYYANYDEANISPGFVTWYNKTSKFRVRAILAF